MTTEITIPIQILALGKLRPIFLKLSELRFHCNLVLGELRPCCNLILCEFRPIIRPISITQKTPRGGWPYSLLNILFYFKFV